MEKYHFCYHHCVMEMAQFAGPGDSAEHSDFLERKSMRQALQLAHSRGCLSVNTFYSGWRDVLVIKSSLGLLTPKGSSPRRQSGGPMHGGCNKLRVHISTLKQETDMTLRMVQSFNSQSLTPVTHFLQ